MTEPKVSLRCPDCNDGTLVERVNKKTDSHFLGCDQFPTCRHSEPLPAYVELIRLGAPQLLGMDVL